MQKVKKIVIPVAGMGTRFLPATKASPKEMLPVLDKPTIQYIVEGAVESGITDVILVTSSYKRAIEDHFDADPQLEKELIRKGKKALAREIRAISELANFIYIRQQGPYGNGTPIYDARHVIGDEPFAAVWGDDIWLTPPKSKGGQPQIKQLLDVFYRYGDPVITVQKGTAELTKHHGVIDGPRVEPGVYQVKKLVEKPGPKKAPSRICSFGGYILTPDIFEELRKVGRGQGGEIWLVDAIANLGKKRPIYAKEVEGTYLDTGSKFKWLRANLEFALADPKMAPELRRYLRKKLK